MASAKNKTNNRSYIQCQNISVEFAFRFLAKQWNNIAYNIVDFSDKKFQNFTLTPENLKILGADLRLSFDIKKYKLVKLKAVNFPCLVILDENKCVIATQRLDKSHLQITDGETIEKIKISDLQPDFEGHIITLQPSDEIQAASTDDQQQNFSVFAAVFSHIFKHHKKLFSQMLLAAMVSNLMLVALPLFIMSVYDRIIPHLAFETLWVLAVGVLIALTIDLFMKLLRQNLTEAIGLATSVKLQSKLFNHLSRLKFKDMPENSGGLAHSTAEFD